MFASVDAEKALDARSCSEFPGLAVTRRQPCTIERSTLLTHVAKYSSSSVVSSSISVYQYLFGFCPPMTEDTRDTNSKDSLIYNP